MTLVEAIDNAVDSKWLGSHDIQGLGMFEILAVIIRDAFWRSCFYG